jgi:hypothetical protein
METEHGQKLRDFKNIVRSRMVRFWNNSVEIKLAIYETLNKFSDRPNVVGWVPGNEAVNTGPALEEIARLMKENAALREQLENSSRERMLYNGLTFEEMYTLLSEESIEGDSGSRFDPPAMLR